MAFVQLYVEVSVECLRGVGERGGGVEGALEVLNEGSTKHRSSSVLQNKIAEVEKIQALVYSTRKRESAVLVNAAPPAPPASNSDDSSSGDGDDLENGRGGGEDVHGDRRHVAKKMRLYGGTDNGEDENDEYEVAQILMSFTRTSKH